TSRSGCTGGRAARGGRRCSCSSRARCSSTLSGSRIRRSRGSRSSQPASRSSGGRAATSGRTSRSRTAGSPSRAAAPGCCSEGGGAKTTLLAPGAIAGALLLIAGPWLWRLALDRDAERAARIRSEERSEVAARVHDSVLQTLALIQRHAQEPRRVAALARRQERALRGWMDEDRPLGDDASSLMAALSTAAADVEELYGVRVELASAGDCPADDALVLAAREAMTNAAKFAGVEEIDVYAEVGDDGVSVFIRDRGTGFDRTAVPPDRRGLAEPIEGRLDPAAA